MTNFRISETEHRKRIEKIREILYLRNLDALYVTNHTSIFYLTGFSYIATERPVMLLVPMEREITFYGPQLEADHVKLKTNLIEDVRTYFDYPGREHPIDQFAKFLKQMNLENRRIGIDNMTGAEGVWGYSGPAISLKLPKATFILADDIIKNMRLIKSEQEINLIKESARWANLAHSLLQEMTSPNLWDWDVAARASREASTVMKKTLGSKYEPERWGITPIIVGYRGQVGEMAAIPHSIATSRPMKQGDVLVGEAGADIGGYSCELERTMFLGKPTERQKKYFLTMQKAQQESLEAFQPGLKCSTIDQIATRAFKKAGYEALMRHHVGHGIGLEGHEPPWLDIGNDEILKAGMVVSCEPGIYEPGLGGFRHSDTVLITNDGAEILTDYPRDLESLTISA